MSERPARRLLRGLMPVLAGAGVALGQAPYDLLWLALAALALALSLGQRAGSAGGAARTGWGVGLGFGLITFVWIVEPFLVYPERDGWLAPFALFFMASGVALFWALGFWLAHRLSGAGGGAARVLALPVGLTLAEMLRAHVLTGFPWGLTAYVWLETPFYQLAAFGGPHALTLATLLIASALASAIRHRQAAPAGLALAAVAFGLAAGAWLQERPLADGRQKVPVVRLIQPNADQRQKWDPAMMPLFYERQLRLSAAPGAAPVDLVIWPEVAVPFLLNDATAPWDEIAAAAGGAPVVLGAQRLEWGPQGQRAFNSLAVIEPGGRIATIHDKYHLVPFGEYIPARAVFERLGLAALAAQYGSGYTAGPGPELIDLGPLGRAQPLICYEAIFPHEIRRVEGRPDFMLMLTNDAWFGKAIGPYQHLAQARARAIEFSLPMLRAANTGVSAVIDARGRIVAQLPLGVDGLLDAALPPAGGATLYWRAGDLPVFLLLIVLAAAVMHLARRKAIDPSASGM